MSRFKLTVLGFLGFIVMLSVFRVSIAQATDNDQFRWDIVNINFMTDVVTACGHTSAAANDRSATPLPKSRILRTISTDPLGRASLHFPQTLNISSHSPQH